jgi:hypothetical protein
VTSGHSCMQFAGREVDGRKDLGEYRKNAMDSQAMPEAIQGRIHHPETAGKGVHFAKDFNTESLEKVLFYVADLHPEAEKSPISEAKP